MKKQVVLLLVCTFLGMHGHAQELNTTVRINHNQIQGTDASIFDNLQQTLQQFINERQWTHLQFQRN